MLLEEGHEIFRLEDTHELCGSLVEMSVVYVQAVVVEESCYIG